MKAKAVLNEVDLAMWELAEASTLDREAARLRKSAAGRMSKVHIDIKDAIASIRPPTPSPNDDQST